MLQAEEMRKRKTKYAYTNCVLKSHLKYPFWLFKFLHMFKWRSVCDLHMRTKELNERGFPWLS